MRIVCLVVPLFPLAARLRCEPELAGESTAIVEGNGPTARVIAATRPARLAGLKPGMTLSVESFMGADLPVALALFPPLLDPVTIAQGADPIHIGIVVCLTLAIGLITPPLGGVMLIVASVTGSSYWALARATLPFVVVEICLLLLIVLVPDITLYLPRLFGLL